MMMKSWSCFNGANTFGHMSGWMGHNFIFWHIGFLVIVSLGIAYLIIHFYRHNRQNYLSALEILAEQYAQGKINEDEYLKRKKNLTK